MIWNSIEDALPPINQSVVLMDDKGSFYVAAYDHNKSRKPNCSDSWIFTLNPGRHKIGSVVRWSAIFYDCKEYKNYVDENK